MENPLYFLSGTIHDDYYYELKHYINIMFY